jgi:hypothetical protein
MICLEEFTFVYLGVATLCFWILAVVELMRLLFSKKKREVK